LVLVVLEAQLPQLVALALLELLLLPLIFRI
jgi:hypothetical protein